MIFNSEKEAIELIKAHPKPDSSFIEMREYSRELKALVNGEDFIEELINKIEVIESSKKAAARRKYSRDIKDVFGRLFQPISNIYYATGGIKDYDVKNPEKKKEFLSRISNIRDGKTLSQWVQENAIQLFNTDPNGVIFLEYKTEPKIEVYPTYKSIDSIRHYESKGQLVEYILFEPEQTKEGLLYRIVDDLHDWTFLQTNGEYTLVEKLSFEHPFGQVPALICSNISYTGDDEKRAAIDDIIGIAKELAQNQSILTLYKIFKGMPLFWKVVQYCGDCGGTGKNGEEKCGSCDGHGKYISKADVTDVIEVPLPEGDEKLLTGDNIGGYLSPPIETWKQFNDELKILEEKMYKSHWGTSFGLTKNNSDKTATEIIFDRQPFENQLNKYADFAEYMEWKLSEWILNLVDVQKDKNESAITINLGRRYVVESPDVLLERYELAVKSKCNTVILDKIFEEYLHSKFRNNPIDLYIALTKAKVEPYLHTTFTDVLTIFGNEEAQRKVLFQQFWIGVTDYSNTDKIRKDFETWFEQNKVTLVN